MSRPDKEFYEFGPFKLDAIERVLFRGGEVVPLKPKVFDTLLVLVESSGHVLDKDELMKILWPDTVVEENNLNQNISALRRALGEGENSGQYIETLPRRGYRFVARVRELGDESADLVVEKHTLATLLIVEEQHDNRALDVDGRFLLPAARREWVNGKVMAGSALIAALAVASYFLVSSRSKQPATISTLRSIAVLPFKPLISDSGDEYLGLGMTDALITRLAGINQVIVRPTSAVRKYTAQEQDSVAIGRELKVESVLDGSIQKAGDRVRLTVQLVRVGDGRHLWTDKFDEKFTDLLAVEDRVSERVASALSLKLSGEERKVLEKHYTENSEAHQLYLKGRYFWSKRNSDGLKKAIEQFQQAIDVDGTYALAYTGLADCYLLLEQYVGTPAGDAYPKAKAYAERALQLDETLAEAHASLGRINDSLWDFEEAEKEFKRAISLNPNYPTGHHWYSNHLLALERLDGSLSEIKRAQELDPLSPVIGEVVAYTYLVKGDLDAGVEQARRVIELDPTFPGAHRTLGRAYVELRRYPEGITEFQRAVDLSNRASFQLSDLGYGYAVAGKHAEALAVANELKARYARREASGYDIAVVYGSLGDKDQAFVWLEKAFQARSGRLIYITSALEFHSLRSDPRYTDLLRRMGLAP